MARPIGIPHHRRTDTIERALGAVVTELRIRRRVSQAALADKLGYSVSYISKLERGEMNPTLRTLLDISDALGAEPDAIIRTMKHRFERAKASGRA